MDLATQPAAHRRGGSKRVSDPESAADLAPPRGSSMPAPEGRRHGKIGDAAAVRTQREALEQAQKDRERATALLKRAEEDLITANQRLIEADAARRHLLENVASGGDEARKRFASAIQEDVLQQLTAAELQLERIRNEAKRTKYAASLAQLATTMAVVETSLRNLLHSVSPTVQEAHVQLADAIRDRVGLLKGRTGIEPDLDLRLPKRIPDAVKSIVFENVSEALNNVEKHASATRVSIKADSVDGGIRVAVADDGTGFVVAESLHLPGHLGLLAMRERARLSGGWCRLESDPGAGTLITFWVPNRL